MKTAEEIINEYAFETYNDSTDDATCIKIELKDAIKIMKLYANQKLDEAALFSSKKYIEINGHLGVSIIESGILYLKDEI